MIFETVNHVTKFINAFILPYTLDQQTKKQMLAH